MVHGRTEYIVAWGPRKNGSKPGKVLANGSPSVSAAVYKAFNLMPSGVCQPSASTFPLGADLVAALFHASILGVENSGHWLLVGLLIISPQTQLIDS
jgi:hypothetical protein